MAGMPLWAVKGPIGQEVILDGSFYSEIEIMEGLFGNYYPGIRSSALDPKLSTDPDLLRWLSQGSMAERLMDWDELDRDVQKEFRAMEGKIPIRYLGSCALPNSKMLVAFEAGDWQFESTTWGGSNFTGSHNLGMAAFIRDREGWKLTGYNMNLGRFGAYCTTTISWDPVKLGDNEYGIMTLDHGRGIFSIRGGAPVLLMKVPHFHGYGHGDPEEWDSVISFVPGENAYYDVVVESSGENYDTGERLSFYRKWVWDAKEEIFWMTDFKGNIRNIIDNPGYWLLDEDY